MKAYPAYKESDTPWLGKIPVHWELELLKRFCLPIKNKNSSLCHNNTLQFRYGEIIEKPDINKSDPDYLKTISEYNVIQANDIVINGLNLNYDFVSQRVAVSTIAGIITSAYIAMEVSHDISSKYLTYLLKNFDSQKLFHGLGKGVRITLTYKILSRILITFPPAEEQQAIVAYLDKKCAEIEELISRKRAIIERLKELKQAMITEAVTKGVRGSRSMKPSGVKWIGDIPEEWKVTKYKYITHINPKRNFSGLLPEDEVSFAPMECIKNGYHTAYRTKVSSYSSSYSAFEENDIVIAKVTPCFENGNIAIMNGLINQRGFGSSELIVLRSHEKCEKFLFYSLQNVIFKDHARSTMQGTGGLKRVSPNWIANYIFPLPPAGERERITAFLDTKCAAIDELVSRHEQIIEKLKELKTVTIADVVTGKVDVRESI